MLQTKPAAPNASKMDVTETGATTQRAKGASEQGGGEKVVKRQVNGGCGHVKESKLEAREN